MPGRVPTTDAVDAVVRLEKAEARRREEEEDGSDEYYEDGGSEETTTTRTVTSRMHQRTTKTMRSRILQSTMRICTSLVMSCRSYLQLTATAAYLAQASQA